MSVCRVDPPTYSHRWRFGVFLQKWISSLGWDIVRLMSRGFIVNKYGSSFILCWQWTILSSYKIVCELWTQIGLIVKLKQIPSWSLKVNHMWRVRDSFTNMWLWLFGDSPSVVANLFTFLCQKVINIKMIF